MRQSRFVRMSLAVGLVFTMAAMVGAQSQADKNKAKPKAKGEPASTRQVYAELMAFFDQKDATRDGYWSKEEIISAYGLPKVNQALSLYDSDMDGRVSRAEYEEWVKENAADIAEEREDAQREYEEAVKKYQAAVAKATKEAKARLQKQIQNARSRANNSRDNRNNVNRNRRNRNRR